MSVDLYERYKDALRRGHMAMARGQLDAAREAYGEAIALAPDRTLPHAGLGQVLLRQGAAAEALVAFDGALARSPRDEIGLRGRGEALARLGRRTDAAGALDLLSDVQEAAGRLGDACDTTRRALELAEQKTRRRRIQDLTRRLRLQAGGQPPELALAKSLRRLAVDEVPDGAVHPEPSAMAAPDVAAETAGPETEADASGPPPAATTEQAEPGAKTGAEGEAADSAAPPVSVPAANQAAATPRPDPIEVMARAEAALDAGDFESARDDYLAAAAAFGAHGLLAAALDACTVVLAFAPDDAGAHLQLVELYLELGWNAPAADKLALLGRLTELDDRQGNARARIVGLAADHFPDDPRLRRLSAPGAARS